VWLTIALAAAVLVGLVLAFVVVATTHATAVQQPPYQSSP
jgi:hypothetical protein